MKGYFEDGKFSQSQGQGWSQVSPWTTYSQPQVQPIYPQMHVSNFEHLGVDNARFFVPLGITHCSGTNLQLSSEEVIPSKNARNALMVANEEEAIIATAKALNGEDGPTSKK